MDEWIPQDCSYFDSQNVRQYNLTQLAKVPNRHGNAVRVSDVFKLQLWRSVTANLTEEQIGGYNGPLGDNNRATWVTSNLTLVAVALGYFHGEGIVLGGMMATCVQQQSEICRLNQELKKLELFEQERILPSENPTKLVPATPSSNLKRDRDPNSQASTPPAGVNAPPLFGPKKTSPIVRPPSKKSYLEEFPALNSTAFTPQKHCDVLLQAKKLPLMMDLDGTLVMILNNADGSLKEDMKNAAKAAGRDIRQLLDGREILVASHLDRFLKDANRYCEMTVVSAGDLPYVRMVVKVLDPAGKLFGNRIHSVFTVKQQKKVLKNYFPVLQGKTSVKFTILMVDDRLDIFTAEDRNGLIQAVPLKTSNLWDIDCSAVVKILDFVQHVFYQHHPNFPQTPSDCLMLHYQTVHARMMSGDLAADFEKKRLMLK